MRSSSRFWSITAVGLALAVYGTASLTGGWLGEPPWWTNEFRGPFNSARRLAEHGTAPDSGQPYRAPYEHRELVSVVAALSGLGLSALVARPRLRRANLAESVRIALVVLGFGGFIYATFGTPDWLWEHFLPSDEGGVMHTNFSPPYFLRLRIGRGIHLEAILAASVALTFVGAWPGTRRLRPLRREPLFWIWTCVVLLASLRVLFYVVSPSLSR